MKIEWNEPPVSRRNADTLWTKVKNSLSVIRQTHDGPPPHYSYSNSPSPSRGSTSRSSSRPPSSHHRSRSSGPAPTYARHVAAASPSGRPFVTIQTSGGPPQVIKGSSGQYGATTTYVVQSPIIYDPRSSSPSPRITSPALGSRPTAAHRSTVPYSPSPLRSAARTASPASPRPVRSSTAPVSGGSNGGMMYNGKLIVGDPNEVQRYISSQKGIEKWLQNVG
jgi:hypothetical protein